MFLVIVSLMLSVSGLWAADLPFANEIAAGFAKWTTATPRTALHYAEHLAAQSDETSKKHAQAIIFHGSGFGGFAKDRTATAAEMKQYYSTINLIKGMIPDLETLGKSNRADVTYHQDVMKILWLSAAGLLVGKDIRSAVFSFKDAFHWLGAYHNQSFKNLNDCMSKFNLFNKKSPCIYNGAFDAVPHIHPYGTDENETNFAHYSFSSFSSKKGFLVFSEPLDSWKGKQVLLRPHAYFGKCLGLNAGAGWVKDVEANILLASGNCFDANGSVHIHDNVASPAGVMVLGEYDKLMTSGPFISNIKGDHSVTTLHILVPQEKQGFLVDQLSTEQLIGYLSFVLPNHACLKFVEEQLECMSS